MARTANPNKPKRGFMDGYKVYDTSEGFGGPSEWRSNFKWRIGVDAATSRVGKQSPREILGVALDCKIWSVIRSAYRKLAIQYHPDKPNSDVEMFKTVSAAFEVLENEAIRGGWKI